VSDELTLGGYMEQHARAAAFEGKIKISMDTSDSKPVDTFFISDITKNN